MTNHRGGTGRSSAKRTVGRPRRLTLNQILDAALELGLDGLTMTRLAQHIGVSVTVLYGYVANREDLLRAAIARTALDHQFPTDTGQHWSDYIADYARTLFALLTSNSQLILSFLQGGLRPHTQADQAEVWMATLLKRGFAPEDAASLFHAVGQLVVGCAAARIHAKALAAEGTTHEQEWRLAVQARKAADLPTLRRHAPVLLQADYGNWEQPLRWVLAGAAARRVEEPPAGSWLGGPGGKRRSSASE